MNHQELEVYVGTRRYLVIDQFVTESETESEIESQASGSRVIDMDQTRYFSETDTDEPNEDTIMFPNDLSANEADDELTDRGVIT